MNSSTLNNNLETIREREGGGEDGNNEKKKLSSSSQQQNNNDDSVSSINSVEDDSCNEGLFNDEYESNNSYSNSNSESNENDPPNNDSTTLAALQEQYTMMIHMTLELVRDMTIVKKNDTVITSYGMTGTLITRKNSNGSMEIKLPNFGTLYHRQPEMVHKNLSPSDYEQAMDHLEQVRKLGFTIQCQQWNVPVIDEVCVPCLFDKPYCSSTTNPKNGISKSNKDGMNNSKTIASQEVINSKNREKAVAKKSKRSWFSSITRGSSSSSSSSPGSGGGGPQSSLVKDETSGKLKKKKKSTKTKFCDVCGNPVCSKHIIPSTGGQQFRMCVDCQFDFTQMFESTSSNKMTMKGSSKSKNNNASNGSNGSAGSLLDLDHIPQLKQTLDRLLTYYTRMALQLTFCVPNLCELANRLTVKERSNSQIQLGTGGVSFVGAALGVAGACAMLTPAGPALLLAAVATSASSAAIQGGHMAYSKGFDMSQKETNQLADRILGWHGLCLGILDALEQLRQTLLQQIFAITAAELEKNLLKNSNGTTSIADNVANDKKIKQQQKANALILKQVLNSRSHVNNNLSNKSTSGQSLEVLNTLALGSYHTTRHGLTGVVSSFLHSLTSFVSSSLYANDNSPLLLFPLHFVFSFLCYSLL